MTKSLPCVGSNDSEHGGGDAGDNAYGGSLSRRSFEASGYRGPSAGCTAVVAMILKDNLIVANAGDSRCVASRNGTAHAMTHDHKPTDEDEAARIQKVNQITEIET